MVKIINRFTANQKLFRPLTKKRSLIINDMLFFNNKIWRVVKLSTGKITLSEHFEANVDARSRSKEKSYKYTTKTPGSLQTENPKRVNISPCGVVKITSFDLKEKEQ